MLSALKANDRLDEVSAAIGSLGLVTARLVDDSEESDEKGYAKAKLVTAHLSVLTALARMVTPEPNTAWDDLAAAMSTPTLRTEVVDWGRPDDGTRLP
jgi:hypothetical protein